MRTDLLKELLATPTFFGKETRVYEFLLDYGIKHQIPVIRDVKGNVYLVKGKVGEGEKYPCVAAHMDTVHKDQIEAVEHNKKLNIQEEIVNNETRLWASLDGKQTGIGGDDKAGIFICLEIMERFDNIIGAFFVEEEFGCRGSAMADKEIFDKVGYVIQFDAPGDNWCSFSSLAVQLFNRRLFNKIQPILEEYNITKISLDPYTDVYKLKEQFDFACMNFFAGYHLMHSSNEFVVLEHIQKAINLGCDIIRKLGPKKQSMKYRKSVDYSFYSEIYELRHKHLL